MDLRVSDLIKRRRPSAIVSASVAVHAAAGALVVIRPSVWPWAAAGIVTNHLLLTAGGLLPRSQLLGPNWTRLPDTTAAAGKVAVTIDDGPDPDVTPAVLDILDQHGAQVTFFCIGDRIAAFPQLARDIVNRGHSIENHSQRHLHRFSLLGPSAMAREVLTAQQTIESVTGEIPRFFRAPAGLRNPFLEPILMQNGLKLVSWTRRGFDTVTQDPKLVLKRLSGVLQGRDIVLLHDGHAARTSAGVPIILEVLPDLLKRISTAGLHTIKLRAA